MAINEIVTNGNTMVLSEIACTQDSINISIPSQPPTIDFCHCDFECEYEELKFASPGNEDYKNDESMYLEELVDSVGTIEFKLYQDGVLKTTIIDNTLGIYTPVGGFPNSGVTDHSLKSGFIADWELIYNTYGGGKFHFEIIVTNFTRPVTKETQKYRLQLFSERSADYTTVIRSTQNGYIQGGLDYTGLEWTYEFRIPGKFLPTVPEFVKTTYQTSSRIEKQIQAQIIRTYELSCDFIPAIISDAVIDDNIMANDIKIMDYNIWNQTSLTYQFIEVVPEGIEEAEYFSRSQNANYIFSFKEKQQNKLKRNFK